MTNLIPEEKRATVQGGLREAFGAERFDDISPVTGGQTNGLVYRVVVAGTPYLLKIIMRNEDPSRHYASMRAAAEAGVAPRVLFTDTAERVSITDFVDAVPLTISEARTRVPQALRVLHQTAPFGRAPFNTTCTFLLQKSGLSVGPTAEGFLAKFRDSKLLPESDMAEFFARLEEITKAYPFEDGEMVSSHNDLFKPDNILFDGQRIQLVDWEAAFLNDRYADLAVVANMVVRNEQEEARFLGAYFGKPAAGDQRARFRLMQQLTHLFYTMGFLTIGTMGGGTVDWSAPTPGYKQFYDDLWARRVDLSGKAEKVIFGRIHWEELRRKTALG